MLRVDRESLDCVLVHISSVIRQRDDGACRQCEHRTTLPWRCVNMKGKTLNVFDSSLLAKAELNSPLTAEYVFGISQKEVQVEEGKQQIGALISERRQSSLLHQMKVGRR